jgi:hypothetical protein
VNLNHPTVLIAFLTTTTLFCACGTVSEEAAVDVAIQGLSETKTIATCSEQVLSAVSENSSDTSAEFTWNITAPEGASFDFQPRKTELSFVARTVGEYLISASDCTATPTANVDCTTTEFAVTVVVGTDKNNNGIGDQCESVTCTPACDGRTCGLDPICNKSCGTCVDGQSCDEAVGVCKAVCIPACDGRTCGLDPICNTSCGTCSDGNSCNDQGQCEAVEQPGRVVTIVMALTDPRLTFTDPHFNQRGRLIEQSVQWVSPVDDPKVLLVLDDICADWSGEAQAIRAAMKRHGISVTFLKEPAQGLTAQHLTGYDVVWFSNPALPVDDPQTIATLTAFTRQGGGLVLQGDDITQPSGLEPLTRLHNISSGKYYCGQYIDDDRGNSYKVTVERTNHPVTAELLGNAYYYGDDIDTSTLIPDAKATVLAWATAAGGCHHFNRHNPPKCEKQPVIVAYDMSN